MAEKIIISTGLKFKSTSFSDTAEVVAVSNDKADVKLTNSEGHVKIIRGWSLPYMRDCFDRGEYMPVNPKEVNISFI